jgi:hypothetical protein
VFSFKRGEWNQPTAWGANHPMAEPKLLLDHDYVKLDYFYKGNAKHDK